MAYDIGPRIGIEGEKEFRQIIGQINMNLKTLGTEMLAVTSRFEKGDKSTQSLTARNEVLNRQIDAQKQKLAELQKGLALAAGKYGENDKVTQGWQQSVNKATADLNNMERELKENETAIKDYGKAQIEAAKSSEEFKAAQEKLGGVIDVVKKAALAAGAAISGAVAASAKLAIDYESAFAGVRKTVDATEAEFAELSKGIRDMAKDISAGAAAIAVVAEAAGQLGIRNENILSFSRTMIDLGEATNLSSEQAASSLAKFANITQMSQGDFDRLGSTIVALGNNLATTEADIVAMGLRLAGAGKQIGLTEAQTLAFAGALSSVGIEAEAGGSAFSRVMVDMQLAVETSSARLNDFASIAGMSSQDFKKAFQEDAAGATVAFIQGLSTAEDRGISAIKVLDDMGITEIRLRDSLLRAAGASGVFEDALQLGTQAWEENTALSKEAEQRYATVASQLQILKNTLVDLGIEIGDQLIPTIKEWVEKLKAIEPKPIVDGFKWLLDNAGTIAAGAAAIGTAMLTWNVASTVTALVKGIKAWKAATEGMTLAQMALNLAMAANPIGLIVTAVAALAAGIVTLWKTNDDFRNGVIRVWGEIKEYIMRAILALVSGYEKLWGWVPKLGPALRGAKEELAGMIEAEQQFQQIKGSANYYKMAASEIAEAAKQMKAFEMGTSPVIEASEKVARSVAGAGAAAGSAGKQAKSMSEAIRNSFDSISKKLSLMDEVTRAQLELQKELLGENADEVKKLELELSRLNAVKQSVARKIEVLAAAFETAKNKIGENNETTEQYAHELQMTQIELQKTEALIKKATKAIDDQAQAAKKAAQEQAKAFGNLADEADKLKAKYRDDLAAAAKDYYSKVRDINARLIEDERKVTAAFQNQLNQRAGALSNFVGLFEAVTSKNVSGEQLLQNLRGQVQIFEDWQENIAVLATRGIDEGLLQELREMGPKAAPEIAALNTLTDDQLKEYVSLWKEKNQAAREEAVTQLQQQRREMEQKLMEIRATAAEQLELYRVEWEKKNALIKKNTEEELQKIEDKFKDLAEDSTKYGQEFVMGFVEGMENRFDRLRQAAMEMASIVASGVTGPLQIASPSKLMASYGRSVVEGFVNGIKDNLQKLGAAISAMTSITMPDLAAVGAGMSRSSVTNHNSGGNNIYVTVQDGEDLLRTLHRLGIRIP